MHNAEISKRLGVAWKQLTDTEASHSRLASSCHNDPQSWTSEKQKRLTPGRAVMSPCCVPAYGRQTSETATCYHNDPQSWTSKTEAPHSRSCSNVFMLCQLTDDRLPKQLPATIMTHNLGLQKQKRLIPGRAVMSSCCASLRTTDFRNSYLLP